jgi:hypothetical protein
MTDDSIARKELSRTEQDGKETIVNEIIHFKFDGGVLESINLIFDDWEYAQEHGVYSDDDGVTIIIVNQILDKLDDRIMNDDTPDKDDTQNEVLVRDYLLKFKGFTIWV